MLCHEAAACRLQRAALFAYLPDSKSLWDVHTQCGQHIAQVLQVGCQLLGASRRQACNAAQLVHHSTSSSTGHLFM